MKKILLGAGIVVVLLLAVSAVQQNSGLTELEPMETTELKDPSRVGDYGVYALDLPKTLDFAGGISTAKQS
ncbi:membrane-bound lytic murein transglycosylase D precursor [Nonlabens ulvanivorans]|nr:membrane-bound lytic murein transglycosylase D precursor [Nonlabens ulvanivorans]